MKAFSITLRIMYDIDVIPYRRRFSLFLPLRSCHYILSDRGMRYRERLSSRILDRAIRVPGCSRAVSKWISRSRECESTCIIASRCDSERARRLFRVNARVTRPSANTCCRPLQDGDVRPVPLAYRDIIYPHMSIYGPLY